MALFIIATDGLSPSFTTIVHAVVFPTFPSAGPLETGTSEYEG